MCKDLQATRRCPVCIQQPSQPPGSFVLLEVLDVPLKLVRGFLALVRVGESFGKGPDLLLGLWIGCDQCVGVGQVPGLQLLTDEAYQGLAATGGAHGLWPCLQGKAIGIVIVPDNDEAGTRFLPCFQLDRNALVEVTLALVREQKKVLPLYPSGDQTREVFCQHGLHGRLFQQEDDTAAHVFSPSKTPCFHR